MTLNTLAKADRSASDDLRDYLKPTKKAEGKRQNI